MNSNSNAYSNRAKFAGLLIRHPDHLESSAFLPAGAPTFSSVLNPVPAVARACARRQGVGGGARVEACVHKAEEGRGRRRGYAHARAGDSRERLEGAQHGPP